MKERRYGISTDGSINCKRPTNPGVNRVKRPSEQG